MKRGNSTLKNEDLMAAIIVTMVFLITGSITLLAAIYG